VIAAAAAEVHLGRPQPAVENSHGRPVADMVLRDGISVAALLVAQGAVWVDTHRIPTPEAPARQTAAQRARRELWRDASAVPPWEWRQGRLWQGPSDEQRAAW
jgi:endonuclease YncB( thermonuclease family)